MKNQCVMVLVTALMAGCAATGENDYSGEPQLANEPGPAPASEVATQAEAPQASKSSKSSLICKRERPTGSNLTRETCFTREQHDEQVRKTREMLRNRKSPVCLVCGDDGG